MRKLVFLTLLCICLGAAFAQDNSTGGAQAPAAQPASSSSTSTAAPAGSGQDSAQQSVQGVNLNEEAANLIQYQQLYQANSKVIQTASTLFQTLLGIFN